MFIAEVCFKNKISLFLLGPDALPDGYEVTFDVMESKTIAGGVSTMVGTNDGSVVS